MKFLLAGMHYVPNQFTRGLQNMGCEWVHWTGNETRKPMPTNCDAVLIAKCQLGHAAFWKAKDTYLGMERPVFISNHSFADVALTIQEWLKEKGHLDAMGLVKKTPLPAPETQLSQAFKKANDTTKPKENVPMSVTKPQFEQVREVVNKVIQEEHAKNVTWQKIADKLNSLNLPTPAGLKWTSATGPAYALKHHLVGRRVNTSAGQAGSTGMSDPSNRQPRQPKQAYTNGGGQLPLQPATRQVRKKSGIQDHDIEEIMTSNLTTNLKLRVIKLLALAD